MKVPYISVKKTAIFFIYKISLQTFSLQHIRENLFTQNTKNANFFVCKTFFHES